MSTIENHDKIDNMGVNKAGDCAILVIADRLTWNDPAYHVDQLEKKLSCYIGYVKTGQLLEDLPGARGLPVRIEVVCQYTLPEMGKRAGASATSVMKAQGIDVRFVML